MQSTTLDLAVSQAIHACTSCKSRKRKCDKRIPGCSLCTRRKWKCSYSRNLESGYWSALRPSKTKVISERQSQVCDFPAVFFLDSDISHRARIEIPRPSSIPIPPYVIEVVGNLADSRLLAAQYFETVHTWIPFISKKRFYEQLLNPLCPPRADHLLLFFCMKLLLWSPSDGQGPKTLSYLTAKRFQLEVEVAGIFTVQGLQASLLITLYEIAHAIYPSAYVSVASCAKLAIALGIDKRESSRHISQLDWVELEERNRIWWTVLILDRFVNLGCPERSVTTQDPRPDDPLPADESAWDQGICPMDPYISLSSAPDTNMCQFARLAQASHLLSHVYAHISDRSTNSTFSEEVVMQLDRTLNALIELSEVERRALKLGNCAGSALCRSALATLHSHYSSASAITAMSTAYSDHTNIVLKHHVDELHIYLRGVLAGGPERVNMISALSLHWIYLATLIQARTYQQNNDEESLEALGFLKTSLKILSGRWMAAGAYLQILEAREIMNSY